LVCRTCGTEIADKALICYRCGTATTEAKYQPVAIRPRRRRSSALIAIVIAVAVLLLAFLWLRSRGAASTENLRPIQTTASVRLHIDHRSGPTTGLTTATNDQD
jgi:hypothetical protein